MTHGIVHTRTHGISHGVDRGGGMSSVSRDAASGIYVPSTAAQWVTTVNQAGLSIGAPDSLWLMQEVAGNLADSIGSRTLTANASPIRGAVQAGWTRTFVGGTGDGAGTETFTGTGVDTATTSYILLIYTHCTTPSSTHAVIDHGTTAAVRALTTQKIRGQSGANIADSTGNLTGAVRPVLLVLTTGSAFKVYLDAEKLVPTFSAPTGTGITLNGQTNTLVTPNRFGFGAYWASKTINDANAKSLLQTLGWTVPWS